MIILGSLLLVVSVLVLVLYPIFRPRYATETTEDETLRDLTAQRDTLYSTLAELQMDYEMGNLSPADHRVLEERHKEKAIAVLRELDAAGAGKEDELDAAIEKQVARLRRSQHRASRRQEDLGETIEQEVRRLRQQTTASVPCPHCGHEIAAAAKFCPACGTAAGSTCPKCGSRK